MQLDLKPSSDWDGWMPPDVSTMYEKFTNINKMSDIPTIGSDPDPADLMSGLAEADSHKHCDEKEENDKP